jgi:hypothetical protein
MEHPVNNISRLYGSLINGRTEHEHVKMQYLDKLRGMPMTTEETDLFCDALASEDHTLHTLLMNAVWEVDRNRMHVMVKVFPYCGVLLSHKATTGRQSTKDFNGLYTRTVTQAWTSAGRFEKMPEEAYQRVASQINAKFLINSLYLNTDKRLFSDLDIHDLVMVPLMQHEELIQQHLTTILDVWNTLREARSSQYLTVDDVIGIAALMAVAPGSEERLISHVSERSWYSTEVAREALNVFPALGAGVI